MPIIDQDKSFCCKGCHTVYRILESQESKESFEKSPIFLQAQKYGIISNKELLKKTIFNETTEIKKLLFEIEGMWCSTCKDLIEILLMQSKGIKSVFVDYTTDLCAIEYSPMVISKEIIFEKINSFGYKPHLLESESSANKGKKDINLYLRLGVASFAGLNIMMLSYPIYEDYLGIKTFGFNYLFAQICLLLTLPIIFFSLVPILKKFWLGLKCLHFGMESLIVIGVASSFFLSIYELLKGSDQVYFDTLAMIVVFVLWGKAIESKAKRQTKDCVFQLHKQLPKKARVKDSEGKVIFKPLKEVAIGDLVIALTGEKIVLDGHVFEGEASVDESLLTGEACPNYKTKQSLLTAGSFVQSGFLVYRVLTKAEDTLIAKLTDLLKEDLLKKKSSIRLVDRISSLFVPVIVIVALVTSLLVYFSSGFEAAFLRFLAILLISCPCALAISIPLVESLLVLNLSKMGILVRCRESLKKFCSVNCIIFDKTGTLTEGKFKVLSKIELDEVDERALKTLAMSSNHPISIALSEAISLDPLKCIDIEEVIGRGVKGTIFNNSYLMGSYLFLKELNILAKEPNCQEVVLFFVKNGKVIQTILLDDALRENIKNDLDLLQVKEKIILSGDSFNRVESTAKYLQLNTFKALFSPFEKENTLKV